MMGHTHLAYGAMFGALAIHFGVQPELTAAFFLGTQIGSLAPDIDHPSSMISKGTTSIVGKMGLFSHRGFTHSIEGIAVMWLFVKYVLPIIGAYLAAGILWVIGSETIMGEWFSTALAETSGFLGTGFAWGFLIGCISHSFIDLFNKPGILLSTLFNIRFNFIGKITRINTGTYAELAFTIVGIALTFWISPKSAAIAAAACAAFWLLIGKPGFPRWKV